MEILGRFRVNILFIVLVALTILLGMSGQVRAEQYGDFAYTIDYLKFPAEATITGYTGQGGDIVIPDIIEGLPVTSIGNSAFEIKFDSNTTERELYSITSITVPESVTNIGERAFMCNYGLNSVSLPDGVKSIGYSAFCNCLSLATIKLPQELTSLGPWCFANCTSLNSITIPEKVDNIGTRVFYFCNSLNYFNVDANNMNYTSLDGVIYDKDFNNLIAAPIGLTTINIPECVKSIGECAFEGCKNLKNIDLPQDLTSIGGGAFYFCSIETINFDEVKMPISIPEFAFYECSNLSSIVLPVGVKSIGEGAFDRCRSLESIQFNSDKTQIIDVCGYHSDRFTIPYQTTIIGHESSTAHEYAKQHGNNFIPIGKKSLITGKDNNKFTNDPSDIYNSDEIQNYFISNDLFSKLTQNMSKNDKLAMIELEYSEWTGECNGISFAMLLSKSGDIDINNFDPDASNFYALDFPKDNEKIRQMLHYYHLSQHLPIGQETIAINPKYFLESGDSQFPFRLVDVLPTIVENAKSIESGGDPFEIGIYWKNSNGSSTGHSVIANGYELLNSGEHKIQIVNPNITDGYNYLYISPDFTTFRMEDAEGRGGTTVDNSNWNKIGYLPNGALNSIDIDGVNSVQDTRNILSGNNSTIYVDSSDNFSVSSQNGDTCNFSELGISGNLAPTSIDFKESDSLNNNSCKMVIKFPGNENYSIIPEQGSIDISICDDSRFAAVDATGVTDIQFGLNNSVKINGNNCNYDARVPSAIGDGIIGISDDNGGNVSIENQDNGIKVHSDNMESINIQTMTESGQTKLATSTDKNEILIKEKPDDQNDVVEVFVSENNDGQFNKKIGETSEISPTERLLGDVDGNGEIQAFDALMALQIATGKKTGTASEIKAANVNGIEGVQAYDALKILQYATGKIKEF